MGDETLLIVVAAEERPTPPGMFDHWCEHPGWAASAIPAPRQRRGSASSIGPMASDA
jgi:hypothetical protein